MYGVERKTPRGSDGFRQTLKTQKKMKTFTNIISTRADFEAWKLSNDIETQEERGRAVVLIVENDYDIYLLYEQLAGACRKAWQKFGGLDLDCLKNSSAMANITRAVRRRENHYRCSDFVTMAEDRAARVCLARRIWEDWLNDLHK